MKKLFPFLAFFITFQVKAQPAPVSLIAQIPYVEASDGKEPASMLNVGRILQSLEPLPDFQIPQRLPNEFILTDLGRHLMEKSQEANGYLVKGEPEKAVAVFTEVLEKWPDELGVRVAYADSLYAAGNHRAAIKEYRRVLEKIPFHFQCLNNLAWLYATTTQPGIRDLESAEALAAKAKLVQPRSHHLWSTLSQIHYVKGEYAEAERASSNALLIVQQMQVNLDVAVSYLIQRDRCILALQATSILE